MLIYITVPYTGFGNEVRAFPTLEAARASATDHLPNSARITIYEVALDEPTRRHIIATTEQEAKP